MKRRIAILGKNGRLGAALCRKLSDKYEILAFGRAELDLTKPIREQLKGVEFDSLIMASRFDQLYTPLLGSSSIHAVPVSHKRMWQIPCPASEAKSLGLK